MLRRIQEGVDGVLRRSSVARQDGQGLLLLGLGLPLGHVAPVAQSGGQGQFETLYEGGPRQTAVSGECLDRQRKFNSFYYSIWAKSRNLGRSSLFAPMLALHTMGVAYIEYMYSYNDNHLSERIHICPGALNERISLSNRSQSVAKVMLN